MPASAISTDQDLRRGQRGSVLMVSIIALVALLGIGVVSMVAVRSDTKASGNDRFLQLALYAAESGSNAGMDYVRGSCTGTQTLSDLVEPNNVNPQEPTAIFGNGIKPGQSGNLFTTGIWYDVTILNNPSDPGFAAGNDTDIRVIVHSVGHAPDGASTTIDVEVVVANCQASCEKEYAQQGMDSRNGGSAVCSTQVNLAGGLRTVGGP
jgi:hypothetical protein